MYCIKCGAKLEGNPKFCIKCGALIDWSKGNDDALPIVGTKIGDTEVEAENVDSIEVASIEGNTRDTTDGQTSLSYAGVEIPTKRKKIIAAVCVALAIILTVVASIYFNNEEIRKQKEDYLSSIRWEYNFVANAWAYGLTEIAADVALYWSYYYQNRRFYGGRYAYIDGEIVYNDVDAINLAVKNNASEKTLDSLKTLSDFLEEHPMPKGKTAEESALWEELENAADDMLSAFRDLYSAVLTPGCEIGDYSDNVCRESDRFVEANRHVEECCSALEEFLGVAAE